MTEKKYPCRGELRHSWPRDRCVPDQPEFPPDPKQARRDWKPGRLQSLLRRSAGSTWQDPHLRLQTTAQCFEPPGATRTPGRCPGTACSRLRAWVAPTEKTSKQAEA